MRRLCPGTVRIVWRRGLSTAGALAVCRRYEVGTSNRAAGPGFSERPPQGPIPLGLATQDAPNHSRKVLGEISPPPIGPKTKGFPSRERVEPQKRLPQFKWCATSKSCSASSAMAASDSSVATQGTRRRHCAARIGNPFEEPAGSRNGTSDLQPDARAPRCQLATPLR